ncbi:hypothetical protein B0T22DRAFT_473062 [Podospora appendiculata]|uniref:NAD(P)-binding protein n=1 Tax=Podospora appendiculata TaxID=314037 RepID=A0AAE0WYY7_9PEZI|nr:hypothetical protein B0T22DRAFT_473062 [Podospora appendiculata]
MYTTGLDFDVERVRDLSQSQAIKWDISPRLYSSRLSSYIPKSPKHRAAATETSQPPTSIISRIPSVTVPHPTSSMGFSQPRIPDLPEVVLTGQTVIVTGATGGIGRELAVQILRRQAALVILPVRSLIAGSATRLEILGDELVRKQNPGGKVRIEELDLADQQSVVNFANRVRQTERRLDLVILNAGINLARFQLSPSGHEMCMQVNLISNALLSLLLLPLIQETARQQRPAGGASPTITLVGSMGQAFNSLAAKPLAPAAEILPLYASAAAYSGIHRYPDTKLFVSLFARQLAAHVEREQGQVTVNTVCPGTVKTGADNNLPAWLRVPMNVNRALRGRSVEDGARAILWAALCRAANEEGSENGLYYANNEVTEIAPFAQTTGQAAAFEKKLWDEIFAEAKKADETIGKGLRA